MPYESCVSVMVKNSIKGCFTLPNLPHASDMIVEIITVNMTVCLGGEQHVRRLLCVRMKWREQWSPSSPSSKNRTWHQRHRQKGRWLRVYCSACSVGATREKNPSTSMCCNLFSHEGQPVASVTA